MDIRKLQRAIVDGLEDVKAQDIVVFNTEHLSPLFERVVIASGTSNRQAKALAASVRKAVREAGFEVMRTEGEDNGEWIIVDCAAAVVHVMQPAIRQYYQLEEIWGDKPVAIKLKAAKTGLVKASEPIDDEAPVKPKKAAGKVTAAQKAATTAPAKKVAAKKVAPKTTAKTTAKAPSKAPAKTAVKPAAKTPAKKTAAKKAPSTVTKIVVNAPKPARKVAAKKAPARSAPSAPRPAVKKVAAKKVAAKKVAAKKAPARKTAR
ncbi:MAG TPA: ribosome silencing factor [Aquabacterium sp.]|uniref:ribosome silencing factor n=1 Tax=Aquabacterium sp. TaxID=1872578 RepID=UPI002E35CC4C|nr:ribosome silencing factor [Aquabacterium sp.]HEX5371410.1 ribosome silencing factor [Aquabacterium sp.]